MKVAPILAAALAVASCRVTDPNEGARVELRTDATLYAPNATVAIAVRNVGSRDIDFKGCPFVLEVWEGSRWRETGWPPRPQTCTMQAADGVSPGQSKQLGLTLPNVAKGLYRVAYAHFYAEAGTQLDYEQRVTNAFRVDGVTQ